MCFLSTDLLKLGLRRARLEHHHVDALAPELDVERLPEEQVAFVAL